MRDPAFVEYCQLSGFNYDHIFCPYVPDCNEWYEKKSAIVLPERFIRIREYCY